MSAITASMNVVSAARPVAKGVSAKPFLGARMPTAVKHASPSAARFVVRAEEETAVTKVERNKDDLYLVGASEQSLSYLDGTLPGDFGFDPLGLSDPEGAGGFITPEWLAYAEVIHGRWAMLGVAGVVAPEVLGRAGIIPEQTGLPWFASGVIPPLGTYDYWASSGQLFALQMALMGFSEFRRLADFENPGSMGKDNFVWSSVLGGSGEAAYPGGSVFNFAGFAQDDTMTMRTKEIKNGRLAMMAMLGVFVQGIVTHKTPVQNLIDHIGDAGANNIIANFGSIGGPM